MKKALLLVTSLFAILLTGCQSTEEHIYDILESVVQLENDFKDQQQPLIELEEEEKATYDEILDIGFKEHDQIVELADKAIELSNQRQSHLNKERESIIAAQEKFLTVNKYIEKLDDDEIKKAAKNFYETMNNRYSLHEQLFDQYTTGVNLDKELYTLLKKENVTLEELEAKIDEINQVYQKVYEINEEFNEKTNQYNEEKVAFYEKAGLEIEKNEDTTK